VDWYGHGENAGTEYHASLNPDGTLNREEIKDEDGTTTVVDYNDGKKTEVKYDKDNLYNLSRSWKELDPSLADLEWIHHLQLGEFADTGTRDT
jgi:hypothetical protein